jgi:hypothetical protein
MKNKIKKIILSTLLLVLFASCSQTYVSVRFDKFSDYKAETRNKLTTDTNVLSNIDNYCVVIYERINFIPSRKAPNYMFRVKKCDEIIIGTDTIKVKY